MDNISKLFSCMSKPKKDSAPSLKSSDGGNLTEKQKRMSGAIPMTKMGPPGDPNDNNDYSKVHNSTRKTIRSCVSCGAEFEEHSGGIARQSTTVSTNSGAVNRPKNNAVS
jgi:hypothetical protein